MKTHLRANLVANLVTGQSSRMATRIGVGVVLAAMAMATQAFAASPHADGEHFSVDAALVGICSAGAECAIAIKVTVRDEFHVNPEYPHKFIAQDAAGVEFLGKDTAKKNVFSKTAGDFVTADPKSCVLTVRLKSQAGTPTITGTLKLGVCSDQNCLLPSVELAVPVTVR